MGVYYTCDFCGTQGKGEYFCKCHAKESKRVQKVRKNSTIVDQVILHEPEGFLLFEKLTCSDEVFYTLFLNGKFSFSSYEAFAEAKRQLKEKSFSKCKCKPFVMCAGCVSRATTFEISKGDPESEDSEVEAEAPVETASGDACKRCEQCDQACVQHGGEHCSAPVRWWGTTPVSSPRVERTSDGRTAADLDAEMDEYNSHPDGCKCYEAVERKVIADSEKAFDLANENIIKLQNESALCLFDTDFLKKRQSDENFAKLTDRIAKVAISEVQKQRNEEQDVVMSTADIEYFLDLWLEDEEADCLADEEIISEKDFEETCNWINTILVACGFVYKSGDWSSYQSLVRNQGKISYCEKTFSTSIKEAEREWEEVEKHIHALGNTGFRKPRHVFRDTEFPVNQNTGLYIPPLHYFQRNGDWVALQL